MNDTRKTIALSDETHRQLSILSDLNLAPIDEMLEIIVKGAYWLTCVYTPPTPAGDMICHVIKLAFRPQLERVNKG